MNASRQSCCCSQCIHFNHLANAFKHFVRFLMASSIYFTKVAFFFFTFASTTTSEVIETDGLLNWSSFHTLAGASGAYIFLGVVCHVSHCRGNDIEVQRLTAILGIGNVPRSSHHHHPLNHPLPTTPQTHLDAL